MNLEWAGATNQNTSLPWEEDEVVDEAEKWDILGYKEGSLGEGYSAL